MLSLRTGAMLQLLLAATATAQAVNVATNYINASSTDFSPVHLTIDTADTSRRNATAPKLYGLMHEDISHSGDGGIYAELLRNRAFQGTPIAASENPVEPYAPVLSGWSAVGSAQISLTPSYPLSWALPTSMQMVIPANATGTVGVENAGWWGMNVEPGQYTFSVNVLALNNTYPSNATTTLTATLKSNITGESWANATIGPIHLDTFRYQEVNVTIYNNASAPNGNNSFALTMDGEEVAGMTFFFALFSLFPETYAGRKNGLRPDIAGPLHDMQPKFLRCPGGNNLEGNSIETRFKWWQTIGPLSERPGRPGTWGYYNTEGLGLQEYLDWSEDVGAETLLAIYAGYSLDGTSYPEAYMQEVLQEALDELEFCLGDTSTKWGAKRAEYGHPEPYVINYVEIGNEDFFSATYPYRFKYLYDGLKQAYPNITLISSAYDETYGKLIGNVTLPSGSLRDDHHYDQPSFFLRDGFHLYDNFQSAEATANVEVLIGEYSVFQLDTNEATNFSYPEGIHIFYPQMVSALGESVYHLGAERNPNTVKLSCYAPQLANRNSEVWTPNMITFEAAHNRTVLSASYWWQYLFAHYRGTESLPVDIAEGNINPLYWASSIGDAGEVYLKVVNTGNQTVDMALSLDSVYTNVNATAIQNDNFNAYNTVDDQTAIYPRAVNGSGLPTLASSDNGTWTWTVPIFSITVLQFNN